jgi:hypothetical protein
MYANFIHSLPVRLCPLFTAVYFDRNSVICTKVLEVYLTTDLPSSGHLPHSFQNSPQSSAPIPFVPRHPPLTSCTHPIIDASPTSFMLDSQTSAPSPVVLHMAAGTGV